MSKIFLFINILLFVGCQNPVKENPLLEYMKWSRSVEYRTFESVSADKEIVILKQESKRTDESTWELTFLSMKADSTPLNKSTEEYTSGKMEMSDYIIFAPKKDGVRQIPAKIINQQFSLKDSTFRFELEYRFRTQFDFLVNTDTKVKFEFEKLDTLPQFGSEFLVVKENSKSNMQIIETGTDTNYSTISTRIYAKGKGLIMFGTKTPLKDVFYKLK